MKKTLTALCFALCASLAFAQTNNVSTAKKGVVDNAAVKVEQSNATRQGDYKASIFTKAEGDTLAYFTFNSMPTVGTLTATDVVGNDTVGTAAHGDPNAYSQWARFANNSAATLQANADAYPVLLGYLISQSWGYDTIPFYSATVNDGFMVMSMIDNYSAWNGSGVDAPFNSYIKLGPIDVTNAPIAEVLLFQYFRKFNYDECHIDYSSDNQTWNTVELNVKGIDMAVNTNRYGWVRVSLPVSAVNGNNLYLRVRYSAPSGSGGGGYFWFVDDVLVREGAAERLTMQANYLFEGFYPMIPQGMQLPVAWYGAYINNGANTQTNVTGAINVLYSRNSASTELVQSTTATATANGETGELYIDPKGWIGGGGFGYNTPNGNPNDAQGGLGYLPTATAGNHYFFSDLSSDTWEHMYRSISDGNTTWMTGDTVRYQVTAVDDNHMAVWSHDNGMLTSNNYWLYGMVASSTFTDNYQDFEGWKTAGYGVFNSYITGDAIPTDANGNPWVIKGVQYVASTDGNTSLPGAEILPYLICDSTWEEGESSWVQFRSVETGANVYTVQSSDLNNDVTSMSPEGTYNVITCEFPNQPVLQPFKSYRVGYYINSDESFFACASADPAGYKDEANEVHYFYESANYYDYAFSMGHDNVYTNLIMDPVFPNSNGGSTRWLSWDTYPMIRLLVGPYEVKPTTQVSFECGDNGVIYDNQYNELCGTEREVVIGSTQNYTFEPDEDFYVDQIFRDGEVIFTNDTTNNFANFYVGGVSESFSFTDDTPVTIRGTFVHYEVGISTVETSVKMSLYPNPATSNAQLNIQGVEGMVELSLIDMSGRVISTSKVNAETTTNIDLNGLAKGAYFVRITNSNMTKVEKLIVR